MSSQKRGTNMKSLIPVSEFKEIVRTNSSPETIVSLLNEREDYYVSKHVGYSLKKQRQWWMICMICGKPVFRKYRVATRRTICSETCLRKRRKMPRSCRGTDIPGRWMRSKIPEEELTKLMKRKGTIAAKALNKVEKKHSTKKPNITWRACVVCGTVFPIWCTWLKKKPKKGRKPPGTYCSIRCRQSQAVRDYCIAKGKHIRPRHQRSKEEIQKARERMLGSKNPAWKGGVTYFKTHGNYKGIKYIRCPKEFRSMARKDGYVMEHRLIVAKKIGRPLLRTEVVHHRNHDPTDNRLRNLMLFSSNRNHKLYEHGHLIKPIWRG